MLHIDEPRVLLLGDVHGRVDAVCAAMRKANARDINTIIQVGDYWAYEDTSVEKMLRHYGIHLYFIAGNHENWPYLNKLSGTSTEPVLITPHVTYMPKLAAMKVGFLSALCLGGAPSVDKLSRLENIDWFPEEVVTPDDARRAREMGEFDLVLTHDCPSDVTMPSECFVPRDMAISWFGEKQLDDADEHRELLYHALENTRYTLLVHGHYHHSYSLKNGDATIVGLGKENDYGSTVVLDTLTGDSYIV